MFPPARLLLFLVFIPSAFSMKPIPEANRMKPDQYPTPYSADEIRKGCPPGRYTAYRIESANGEPFLQVSEFTEETGERAYFRGWRESLEGEQLGEAFEASAAWSGLQSHAGFPADATVVSESEVEVPAGTWTCWIYTVTNGDMVNEFAFAQNLPGPPIRMVTTKDGERVYAMTLVENRNGE